MHFGAATGRTPESIYQELFSPPSPKTDGESQGVTHRGQQSGCQLRTHRAAVGTGWTYVGGEPPWNCCHTKQVTLTLGQPSWEPSQ